MAAPILVTLENFEQVFPVWKGLSAAEAQYEAIVDMGSNGIRFSITNLCPPTSRLLPCVYKERSPISLFDALLDESSPPNTLPETVISAVADTVHRFHKIACSYLNDDDDAQPASATDGHIHDHFVILATEAVRRADNAGALLQAIFDKIQVNVHILTPPVETMLGAVMGSRSTVGSVPRGGLFLDLGGGSVQMAWVDTTSTEYPLEAARSGISLPYGAARLSHILQNAPIEERASEVDILQDKVGEAFSRLCQTHPKLQGQHRPTVGVNLHPCTTQNPPSMDEAGVDIYLCGGGFRGYGSLLMSRSLEKPYPFASVGGFVASGEAFRDIESIRSLLRDDHIKERTEMEEKDKKEKKEKEKSRKKDKDKTEKKEEKKEKKERKKKEKVFAGISKRRKAQLPAILTVIEALCSAIKHIRTATFLAGSNREGYMMMRLPLAIRESNPLAIVHQPASPQTAWPLEIVREDSLESFLYESIQGAFPLHSSKGVPTIRSLGLLPIFTHWMWQGQGRSADENAALVLHAVVSQYSDTPNMLHISRAILGLALVGRWGGDVGGYEKKIHGQLQKIANAFHPMASFWALCAGMVACMVIDVTPYLSLLSREYQHKKQPFRFEVEESKEGPEKGTLRFCITVPRKLLLGMSLESLEASWNKSFERQREDHFPDALFCLRVDE